MSAGRSGAGQSQTRAAAPGPQPLKATVPYQLASKPRSHRRVGKSAGKDKLHQLSSGMRRTVSLDAIIGPYLQGHWPKEPEGQSSKDKSTQIAKLKQQLQQRNKPPVSGGHDKNCQRGNPQRSCSLGTTQLLEIPDGHRAPVPPQSCSSGSQSDPATTPLSSSSSSPCSSPNYISISLPNSQDVPVDLHQGLTDSAEMCLLSPFSTQNEADLSLPLLISSSPGPNKSCCFQREPPEGCEKVRVWEETSTPRQSKPTLLSSCPDPNKVNFTPYGGSAFCPVSLLKPLLPSMDLLFRSLAVSPLGGCSNQGTSSCQASSSDNRAAAVASDPPVATGPMGESAGQGLAF
ncbi:hypothetical protein F2P81_022292 [Scophthalmus maximus]|uniref:Protein FAM117A-like n=1 Tax=Scophthalmus maximus TaxID=52904 RepID=A0A6A4S2L7_SCOMX|nr:hypothetical protein F2P81_022292 [Scophthalmus maximus]